MQVGEDVHTPKCSCVACGCTIDAATGVSDNDEMPSPKENDITICLECGHLMAFKPDLTLRELTGAEIVEIAGNPLVVKVQTVRADVMKKHRS